jgi:choice-of-anchor B domain-containing protein
MIQRFYSLFAFMIFTVYCCAQLTTFNASLMSNVKFNEAASGMWGFTQDGIDYAVIGTINTTKVYSIKDPKNPRLVYDIPASNSIWREARYHKGHIYVTNDRGNDGIIIINMSDTSAIVHKNFKPLITLGADVDKEIKTCHAINMDARGLLSLTGCNVSARGVLMFDVDTDPFNPKYLGATDLVYAHDTYNDGDTMYVSEITSGRLGIYNIVDKANPVLINTQTTSKSFTHNAWTSVDKKYIFTTDEREGAWVDAYEISDLNELKLVDKYQISTALKSIPHNTYNNNDYLITSWYTEGIRIIDVHRPENMIEVAGYDTWEDPTICHSGFHGCWGVYPFAQNNLVFGSDIENGLYIVKFDYKRACYLEGTIKDANGNPIPNVKVEILTNQLNGDLTNGLGEFKTGVATAGTYDVAISHTAFPTKIIKVDLKHGEVTLLNEILIKDAPHKLTLNISSTNSQPLVAKVTLRNAVNTYEYTSNAQGLIEQPDFKPGDYSMIVTSWGHKPQISQVSFVPAMSTTLNIKLENGYFTDVFETDQQWQIVNEGSLRGAWFRGVPRATYWTDGTIVNPNKDSDDIGSAAFITGAEGTPGASCDDLDNGKTSLFSPVMDLTTFSNPTLSFDAWFYNIGGNGTPNDTLTVSIFDGTKTTPVRKVFGITGGWKKFGEINIKDFVTPNKTMQLVVSVEDLQQSGHIVEAGFDNFVIGEGITNNQEFDLESLSIQPNPVNEVLVIDLKDQYIQTNTSFEVVDIVGRALMNGNLRGQVNQIEVSTLAAGTYFIKVSGYKPSLFIKQ